MCETSSIVASAVLHSSVCVCGVETMSHSAVAFVM